MAEVFAWPMVDRFIDRAGELARLEGWWASDDVTPVNLYGRRRVGKSWLFRRFAHGKPAVLLVARKTAIGPQLDAFAHSLEPVVGVRPVLDDLAGLFRVLLRAAATDKLLVVIDEFPWLLPSSEAAVEAVLSTVQAVLEEERDSTRLKLIVCGSLVGQMEALQAERNPLHGRLTAFALRPLPFDEATLFLTALDPLARFERFAITGGMPRYLDLLGREPELQQALVRQLLSRDAPLWDEGRVVLEQELREPKMYFAVLQALASGDKDLNEIAQAVRAPNTTVSKYLTTLSDMGITGRHLPVGADPRSRSGHWHLDDPFLRFWFRFVFPYQDELENGLSGDDLFTAEIAPALNQHVSVEFEAWCRRWTRAHYGTRATRVGPWWGPATPPTRAEHGRTSEEIDIVGIARNRVTLVGEAKWRNEPAGVDISDDLDQFKLPALRTAGYKLATDLKIVVFSRAGYTPGLIARANTDNRIELIDVTTAIAALDERPSA